jgi:hypothetical protein
MRPANLRWLTKDEGGREYPPTGQEYVTVARFKDPAGDWSRDAWSVVVRFLDDPQHGEVGFLVDEAPDHLLQSGSEFELYEGAKKVAEVTVL